MNTTIINILVGYLRDRDILNLLSTCREFASMRKHVRFTGYCRYDRQAALGIQVQNVYMKCGSDGGEIPPGVTHVYLHKNFNSPIVIPEGVVCIRFGNAFNQPVTLPKSIRSVYFGDAFNQRVVLPEGVHTAHFGRIFTQPLALPKSVRNLQLGNAFNQPIKLNDGLEIAVFGKQYNQPTIFPASLRSLRFGKYFNQPVLDELPKLERLEFGHRFDRVVNLEGMISLKHLKFGFYYRQPINFLPDLEHLTFGYLFNHYTGMVFPDTIKYLEVPAFAGMVLPNALEHLVFMSNPRSLIVYPVTLKSLKMSYTHGHAITPGLLPDSITHLELGYTTNNIPPGCLPTSLKYLDMGTYNGPLVVGMFPDGIEEIHLPMFNWSLHPGVFPNSIKKLVFGRFGGILKHLPRYLEHLDLGNFFNVEFSGHDLPRSLKTINFGQRFEQPVDYIPPGMDRVEFKLGFNHPLPDDFTCKHLIVPINYKYITDSLRKRVQNIRLGKLDKWVAVPLVWDAVNDEPVQ